MVTKFFDNLSRLERVSAAEGSAVNRLSGALRVHRALRVHVEK